MATIFLIQCFSEYNIWMETSGACTSRKNATEYCKNLNINFPDLTHKIETITLNGVVESQMEKNCYIFGMNEK